MLALLAVLAQVAAAPPSRDTRDPLCNEARITAREAILTAHPAPGSRRVARLPRGTTVYACDEHLTWFQAFFSRSRHSPCAHVRAEGLRRHIARTCPSGWIDRHDLELLSG